MKITPIRSNEPLVGFWRLHSDSGKDYIVMRDQRNGQDIWTCTCPDWTFRGQVQHRLCKHAAVILENEARNEEKLA
jgi:hypothetical protein